MTKDKLRTKSKRGRRKGQSVVAEKVLDLLSATAETLDSFGNFTYNPYPYIYASVGHVHNRKTINEAIDDLTKKGLIEGSKEKGLRLTSVGADIKNALYRQRQEEWDGKWRVVIFDIPERQRDIRDGLRAELRKLGFGLWQRSAWVTPFDIAEELSSYLRKQNLSKVVQVVVGKRVGGSSDREFAAEVWPLKEINEKYLSLLANWGRELKQERSGEERLRAATDLHNRYLDVLSDDPRLPKEILPDDWVGDDAHELFRKLKSTLAGGKPF